MDGLSLDGAYTPARLQGGFNEAIRSKTGQEGWCAPGKYPILMRNSPTISPPVNRKVLLNSFTHSCLL